MVGDNQYSLQLYLDALGGVVAWLNMFSSIQTQKFNLIILNLEYKLAYSHINIYISFFTPIDIITRKITLHFLRSIKYKYDVLQFRMRIVRSFGACKTLSLCSNR